MARLQISVGGQNGGTKTKLGGSLNSPGERLPYLLLGFQKIRGNLPSGQLILQVLLEN